MGRSEDMHAFDIFLGIASVIVGSRYLIFCAYHHINPFFDYVIEEEQEKNEP